MPATPAERRELRRRCTLVVPDFATGSAAEDFRALADWCEAGAIEHDMYGPGALVEAFEGKVAASLGKQAAMFAPSGVMAQIAAVRIWTEAAGVARFGMHPTSHLAHHEEQAYAALMHCHGVPVGGRLRPMLAADLEAVRETLARLLVELPIRDACWLVDAPGPAEVPAWCVSELYVGDQLLAADNERVVGLFAQLCETIATAGQHR